jgi:hypothetical protein
MAARWHLICSTGCTAAARTTLQQHTLAIRVVGGFIKVL